jgi:hypothetical protein
MALFMRHKDKMRKNLIVALVIRLRAPPARSLQLAIPARSSPDGISRMRRTTAGH